MYKYFFLYTIKNENIVVIFSLKIHIQNAKSIITKYKVYKALVEIKGDEIKSNLENYNEISNMISKLEKIKNLTNIHESLKKFKCGDDDLTLYDHTQLSNIILDENINTKTLFEKYLNENKKEFLQNLYKNKKSFY